MSSSVMTADRVYWGWGGGWGGRGGEGEGEGGGQRHPFQSEGMGLLR